MGKKYSNELVKIDQTLNWALNEPIDFLESFFDRSYNSPLITIGSGGSYSAACMAALLHQNYGNMGIWVSPLEFTHAKKTVDSSNVLVISSEGHNTDILSIFEYAAKMEPLQLTALCMKKKSPLADLCKKYQFSEYCGFDIPSQKDGFLATNSLLATMILLIRCYQNIFQNIPKFTNNIHLSEEKLKKIHADSQKILNRDTLVVLYSGWGYPAAIDLESKSTEGAIVNVQLADYRNFAHGRHNWLAKNGGNSGIIALITPDDLELAEKTLSLIPDEIPILRITTQENGPTGTIEILIKIFHLVQILGQSKKIDPGMPKIPIFGRKIYHLKSKGYMWEKQFPKAVDPLMAIAIIRKNGCASFGEIVDLNYWKNAYKQYRERIESTSYGSLVFDYDGTLCDAKERYCGPSNEISSMLNYLLERNVTIGIATGRGKSVRTDLQKIIQKKYWDKVVIGYYNGSDIALLNNNNHPDLDRKGSNEIEELTDLIKKQDKLLTISNIKFRPHQISIEPKKKIYWARISQIINQYISSYRKFNLRLFESSHSFDIVDNSVSKINLVDECKKIAGKKSHSENVLCIGDKGKWPGNDFELLSTPYSLSVHTVSLDPTICWNLSPPGCRGIQSTLYYTKLIKINESGEFELFFNKQPGVV
ncbi:HAD hydrolase family protein [Methanoregula sp.]|jgi:hydroxymethylpyrimidine pyrophosphatase-like HAD family hydrolase|uniref:HAD hydrolase family protein n=1 Tax=Methanoregula sp. TaxID=2052170 RepID=UPI003C1602B0